jgi:hypothetical protein
MGPHLDDLHYFDIFKDLIDEARLNICAAGISAREISHEFLIRRGTLEGVCRKDVEQRFGFFLEAGSGQFTSAPLGLSGIDNLPLYHPGFSLHFSTGVLSPLRIDSRIPGMERRYRDS